MDRLRRLLAVLLAMLVLAPVMPSVAGADEPAATPVTFNVVRLSLFSQASPIDYDAIAVDDNRAFLIDNLYDSGYPPASHGYVDLFLTSDPQNPVYLDRDGDTGQTMGIVDAKGDTLVVPLSLQSMYSSIGAFEVYDLVNGVSVCRTALDYDKYGMALSAAVAPNDITFLGVGRGLAVVDVTAAVNNQCVIKTLFESKPVYDIAEAGTLLYLG